MKTAKGANGKPKVKLTKKAIKDLDVKDGSARKVKGGVATRGTECYGRQ